MFFGIKSNLVFKVPELNMSWNKQKNDEGKPFIFEGKSFIFECKEILQSCWLNSPASAHVSNFGSLTKRHRK